MIKSRRAQRSFGDGFITAEIEDLREPWMTHVDAILADNTILFSVDKALSQRHPQSRRRGRPGFPAEVVLRLLILKHIRNWSYAVLEREVRANLVYRDFTRRQRQDARRENHGSLGCRPGAWHDQGYTRENRANCTGQRRRRRAQDARRHHCGGDQHPFPH